MLDLAVWCTFTNQEEIVNFLWSTDIAEAKTGNFLMQFSRIPLGANLGIPLLKLWHQSDRCDFLLAVTAPMRWAEGQGQKRVRATRQVATMSEAFWKSWRSSEGSCDFFVAFSSLARRSRTDCILGRYTLWLLYDAICMGGYSNGGAPNHPSHPNHSSMTEYWKPLWLVDPPRLPWLPHDCSISWWSRRSRFQTLNGGHRPWLKEQWNFMGDREPWEDLMMWC